MWWLNCLSGSTTTILGHFSWQQLESWLLFIAMELTKQDVPDSTNTIPVQEQHDKGCSAKEGRQEAEGDLNIGRTAPSPTWSHSSGAGQSNDSPLTVLDKVKWGQRDQSEAVGDGVRARTELVTTQVWCPTLKTKPVRQDKAEVQLSLDLGICALSLSWACGRQPKKGCERC